MIVCKNQTCQSTYFIVGQTKGHIKCARCAIEYTNVWDVDMEEISTLDMDLLTVLSRIYQARHLIERIDPMAERILTNDAPRLAHHVSVDGMKWIERTDLDTGLVNWLIDLRAVMPK